MKKRLLGALGTALLAGTLVFGIPIQSYAEDETAATSATSATTSGGTTTTRTVSWESHITSQGDGTLFYSATIPTRSYIKRVQGELGPEEDKGWAQKNYYSNGRTRSAEGNAIRNSTWSGGDFDKGFIRETHVTNGSRPRGWLTVGWIISAAKIDHTKSPTNVEEYKPGNLNWEIRLINDPTNGAVKGVERHDVTDDAYAAWRGVYVDPTTYTVTKVAGRNSTNTANTITNYDPSSPKYESENYAKKKGETVTDSNRASVVAQYTENDPKNVTDPNAHRFLVSYNVQSNNIDNVTFYYMDDIYDQIKLECPDWWDYIEKQREIFNNGGDAYIAFKLDAMQYYMDGDWDKWSSYMDATGHGQSTRWDGSTAIGNIMWSNTATKAASGTTIPIIANTRTGINYVEAYNVPHGGLMTKYSAGSLGTDQWNKARLAWQNTGKSTTYSPGSVFSAGPSVMAYYNIGVEFITKVQVERIDPPVDEEEDGESIDHMEHTTIGRRPLNGVSNGTDRNSV